MVGFVCVALHRSMSAVIYQTVDMRDRFIGGLIGLFLAAAESSSNAALGAHNTAFDGAAERASINLTSATEVL